MLRTWLTTGMNPNASSVAFSILSVYSRRMGSSFMTREDALQAHNPGGYCDRTVSPLSSPREVCRNARRTAQEKEIRMDMSRETLTRIFTETGKDFGYDSAESDFVAFRDFV